VSGFGRDWGRASCPGRVSSAITRLARSIDIGPLSWLQYTGRPAIALHSMHGLPGAPWAGLQFERLNARSGRSA